MLIDASDLDEHATIEADVVIAGGGMAGIALAHQLGEAGLDVAVLESGGMTPDMRVQSLYAGKMTLSAPGDESKSLDDYLASSRVRCFGGSGLRWGGKCAPLDPIDFEKRDWIAHSGWPLTRERLQPFYDRACATLRLPVFGAAPESVLGARDPIFRERSAQFTLRPRRYSLTTGAIGDAYDAFRRLASDHPRVRVYLNSNVVRVRLDQDGVRVQSLEVRELSGRRHTARGRAYILALGGIENVRLLLASNDVQRDGVGNHSGWLGRGFQGHAVISRNGATSLSLHRADADLAMFNNAVLDKPHAVIGASEAMQRRRKTVNFTATLNPPGGAPPAANATVAALAQRLSQAQAPAPRTAYFMIEHTPNRDSRIALAPDEVDELGMPRVRVDMRYNEIDLASFDPSLRALAQELGRTGAGRLHWAGPSDRLVQFMASPSRHHMGAARMAVVRSEGVVNEHCRVHDIDNLYVAGSAVFPTSGIANPTLTLLALAHRLGDHIASGLEV